MEPLIIDKHKNIFVYNDTTNQYNEWTIPMKIVEQMDNNSSFFYSVEVSTIIKIQSTGNYKLTMSISGTLNSVDRHWTILLNKKGEILRHE